MKAPRPIETKSKVSTRAELSTRLAPVTLEPLKTTGKRGMEETTYSSATASAYVRSGRDVPARCKEPRNDHSSLEATTFGTRSTLQQSTHAGVGPNDVAFFSRARMEERRDDEQRHGLDSIPTRSGAGRMQRTVDIMRKRETDPHLAPVRESYEPIERRPQNGIPKPTKLETVRFTYAMPTSSQQMDYRSPSDAIPSGISPLYNTQRRVMSECASSRDLFYATTKSRADVLPGYMAHVPGDAKTLATLHGETDVLRQYAKGGHLSAAKVGSIANPMPPRSAASQMSTSQGFYLEQAVSSPTERSLNQTKCGKKSATFN